jgi:hypothetical protein
MAQRKAIVGLKGIDNAIKSIAGIATNLNERVQEVAVAIVQHAAGEGNGDMSRALVLCKTTARFRTLNTPFLIGWFRYFGNANINLKANDGAGKVSLHARDSKAYRGGFDVDGAKANNWFDAFDAEGNRSKWYAGPDMPDYEPMGLVDIATRMTQFAKNTRKLMDSTKEVKGKEVPAVVLSDDDKVQVNNALAFIERISATLSRHDRVVQLQAELEKTEQNVDETVEQVIQIQEKAVA